MKQIAYSMFSILVCSIFFLGGILLESDAHEKRVTELTDLHQRCLDGMDSLRHQEKVVEWNREHKRRGR